MKRELEVKDQSIRQLGQQNQALHRQGRLPFLNACISCLIHSCRCAFSKYGADEDEGGGAGGSETRGGSRRLESDDCYEDRFLGWLEGDVMVGLVVIVLVAYL